MRPSRFNPFNSTEEEIIANKKTNTIYVGDFKDNSGKTIRSLLLLFAPTILQISSKFERFSFGEYWARVTFILWTDFLFNTL